MTGHDDSTINIVVVIIIIIIVYYVAHQHKAAGRKTRLDIQNYGCNRNLLYYYCLPLRQISSRILYKTVLRELKRKL